MAYDLQQLADKLAIQELVFDYAEAIDQKDFDRLDQIFTPDAFIDYTEMGGIKGQYPEVKAFLQQALPGFPAYYHLNANVRIHLHGDTAEGRIMCFNPMGIPQGDGSLHMMMLGLWYVDSYQRGAQGWRISQRVEQRSWGYNIPSGMPGGS